MSIVACFLLLLSCGTAGQATPTSTLATLPAAGLVGMRRSDEQTEILVKRTSRSSSHRRMSPQLQGTGLLPVPPTFNPPGAPPASHPLGGLKASWPALSRPAPSQVAGNPSASNTELSERYYTVERHPYGSIKNDLAAQHQSRRDTYARSMEKLKAGYRINRMGPGGIEYGVKTIDEHRARKAAQLRQYRRGLTAEKKAKMYQKKNEKRRKDRAERKERTQESSRHEPPFEPRDGEQEQGGSQDIRQHAPADTSKGEAAHSAGNGPISPPSTHRRATMRFRMAESPSGSSTMHAFRFPPVLPHPFFPPGPSSSSLDLGLSMPSSDLSTAGQRETSVPRQAAPPSTTTWDDERLRLTLAPPDQHDRLRLTLAQPRHE